MYVAQSGTGQIEVVTTPFYHPILPLIDDSDLAKVAMPDALMPLRFHFPQDAEAQVAKAVKFYHSLFGKNPRGMWPGEGSVAKEIIPIFSRNNVRWIATDMGVLSKSTPPNQPPYFPYLAEGTKASNVVVVFRETDLSDRIGFRYQQFTGEAAADDFIRGCLHYAPAEGEPDRLLTVILDGENAWEWYQKDMDGKEFLRALYRKLSHLYDTRQIVAVTPSEYLEGNPSRNVPSHSPESLPHLTHLWPGSWIHANFDTWIGEDEENRAWGMLRRARMDLAAYFLDAPDHRSDRPKFDEKRQAVWDAYEAMYAAEGSDWFWWFGSDQEIPTGDKPFDDGFRILLRTVYEKMRLAGAPVEIPELPPIIKK
jgi:alpha-amylase/alpha-mannosidase (GH57 family)